MVLEYSCRTGRCGVCKVQAMDGKTEVIQAEESLTEQDKSSGYILTCCREVKSDIYLNVEDLGELANIKSQTLPCRIDSIQKLSDDVIEIILRMPPSGRLEYLPGQYVDIIGKDGLRRSYSIANAPRQDGKILLQIRKVDDGVMSQYWFNEAKTNDLLRLEGPLGTFCLRQKDASHLILLATGTGIAPIKAILEKLAESPPKNNTYSHIHLYWGGRLERDIYWQPNFSGLPVKFNPVISRDLFWSGRKGHVQQAVIEDGIDLNDAVVYACGSEVMIYAAYKKLVSAGLNSNNFYSDAFVSSN